MKATALPVILCLQVAALGCKSLSTQNAPQNPAVKEKDDVDTETYAAKLLHDGREIFRYDTFGSEAFWGGQLRLHEAIAGSTIPRDAFRRSMEDRLVDTRRSRRGVVGKPARLFTLGSPT